MLLLGLTGSIGMGKSLTLQALKRLTQGAAFYDADAAVHALYKTPSIISAVKQHFPAAVVRGVVDRKTLGKLVFGNALAQVTLRHILYPHLAVVERRAVMAAARRRAKLMVLDIPLLFETNADARLDRSLLVTAPPFVQAARVLARPGMDRQRFVQVNAAQMHDSEKRKLADYIVQTGLGRAHTARHLQKLLRLFMVQQSMGRSWRRLTYLKEFYARNRS